MGEGLVGRSDQGLEVIGGGDLSTCCVRASGRRGRSLESQEGKH
jgi:hypothetical protein